MDILSIVSEYNPLHNGHLYHFKKSVDLTSADVKVAIMSGNFVQRGEPLHKSANFLPNKSAITNS